MHYNHHGKQRHRQERADKVSRRAERFACRTGHLRHEEDTARTAARPKDNNARAARSLGVLVWWYG